MTLGRQIGFQKKRCNFPAMKAWLCAVAVFLLCVVPLFAAASDWKLYRCEGRDYVSLDNIATFYGFPEQVPPARSRPRVRPLH